VLLAVASHPITLLKPKEEGLGRPISNRSVLIVCELKERSYPTWKRGFKGLEQKVIG
jgi:hypothetical protein